MRNSSGIHYSEGARRARAILAKRGAGAQAALEAQLKGPRSGKPLARGVLTRLLSGARPMSLPLAEQLLALLQIPTAAWGKKPMVRRRAAVTSGTIAPL